MFADILLVALGIVLLAVGAEGVVRGALAVARPLGITPLLAGIVIVGFGTSAPELVVSVSAAVAGRADVAVGNVVGSNVANVLLVLGVAAVLQPIAVARATVLRDVMAVIAATLVFFAAAVGGLLSRVEAILFLVLFAGYLVWAYRGEHRAAQQQAALPVEAAMAGPALPFGVLGAVLFLVGGLALLFVGARLLVTGAVNVAAALAVSEAAIALTLVALGTSLPELAVSLVAAVRGRIDLAVGNVLGSNIFNLLAVLGVSAAVRPLSVHGRILAFDQYVMLGAAVLAGVFLATGLRLDRWEGGVLILAYAVYVGLGFAFFSV